MQRTAVVLMGLALLTFHSLRQPALWHDEAAMVLNVLVKDLSEVCGPLLYYSSNPPLFLCLERLALLTLGDSLLALRFPTFLASVASLILFAFTLRHWVSKRVALALTLLFGCSDRFLWHGTEAKPYAVDLLVSTGVLALYTASRTWSLHGRLTLFACLAPLLPWLSYPAIFVVGGLFVALFPEVRGSRSAIPWGIYTVGAAAVAGSFVLLAQGPIRAQRCPEMDSCWTAMFPDWQRPWLIPLWLVRSTVGVFSYCCQPIGIVLVVPTVLGVKSLWQRGERKVVLLLVAPLVLTLMASLAGKYPYGGARVLFFATPAILLLSGAGWPTLAAWLERRLPRASRLATVVVLAPLCLAGFRVAFPWPRAATDRASAQILAERQPEDRVVCNCWEGFYYFRDLMPPVRSLHEPEALESPTRIWALVVAAEEVQREAITSSLGRDRQILAHHDYPMARVLLLSPPRVPQSAKLPRTPEKASKEAS